MTTGARAGRLGSIGLVLALPILPIVLSGAVLVGQGALDRLPHPGRPAAGGSRMLPADQFVDLVRRDLPPGARVASLTLPRPGQAVTVTVAPLTGTAGDTDYYLDPPTGHRLGVAGHGSDLLSVLRPLHHGLGMGSAGRVLVGVLSLALMLSCLTGHYIGWPYGGGWRRVLRDRPRSHRLAAVHHLLGLVTVGPLFLLALSGAWLAFPSVFGPLAGGPRPSRSEPARARPMARPAQPLAVILGRAADLHPNAAVRMIVWPTERDPDWTLRFADPRVAAVKVADDTGSATAVSARPLDAPADRMRGWHGGAGLGPMGRGILVLAGLLYAAMTITGLILWRRNHYRRADHDAAVVDV